MPDLKQSSVQNLLLRTLEPCGFDLLGDDLERVALAENQLLATAGDAIEFVYFPENTVVALVDVLSAALRVEVGLAGLEGMTGWHAALGHDRSPFDAVVRIGGGTALRFPAARLAELCSDQPRAFDAIGRYVGAFTVQMGRTAASNLHDRVGRRLSRWLLMCHDRLDGNEINLTHRAVASVLGMRRASVTDGLHQLESDGMIRNQRSRILITDRSKLRLTAGDAYGFAERCYSEAIAPFGK